MAEEQRDWVRQAPGVCRWGLLLAVGFLTVVPVCVPRAGGDNTGSAPVQDMSPALPWFPVVGCLIGAGLALLDWALSPVLALPVRNAALLAASALITGMLHLDGFADCCDALLGTHTVERRLEILKDSRVGAYGAIGVGLLLIARFAALGEIHGSLRVLALVAAPLLSRCGIVGAVTSFPYARPSGLGSAFQRKMRYLVAAGIITAGLLALTAVAVVPLTHMVAGSEARLAVTAGLCLVLALLVTLASAAWASRRLGGGLTGDVYGAVNELVELAVLALAPFLYRLA